MARCYFSYNHGRPLIDTDLVYMNLDDVLIAPKRNGIGGRMCIYDGCAVLVLDDKRIFKSSFPSANAHHEMRLQIEAMDYDNDPNILPKFIVTDVYTMGRRTPTHFRERWSLFTSLYRNSIVLTSLVVPQDFYMFDRDGMVKYWETIKQDASIDGLVLQNVWAMPGSFKDGLGSARYIKKTYTIDVEINSKIWEVDLEDFKIGKVTKLRQRTDKIKANTEKQFHMLNIALKFDDWYDHTSLNRCVVAPKDFPCIFEYLENLIPYDEIPMYEKNIALSWEV